jgi:uroporphyrinogen-III synthase
VSLSGLRVAVLRSEPVGSGLGAALAAFGATPVHCPLRRTRALAGAYGRLRAAVREHVYDWIVFTSSNAVAAWVASEVQLPSGIVAPAIAAVGPATAAALADAGLAPTLVPEQFTAEALSTALGAAYPLAGRRVLFPRATDAQRVVPESLRLAGAVVDEIDCYEKVDNPDGAAALRRALAADAIDAIVFTAPSQVSAWLGAVGSVEDRLLTAAIGPATAAAARRRGVRIDVVAPVHTLSGVAAAMADYQVVSARRFSTDISK